MVMAAVKKVKSVTRYEPGPLPENSRRLRSLRCYRIKKVRKHIIQPIGDET